MEPRRCLNQGVLERISKIIGDTSDGLTGSEIAYFLKQCNTNTCVEEIDVVYAHNHQVSTSLTISAPCRSSFAIVIASAEPPKLPLNFASASSKRALSSSLETVSLGMISLFANHSRSVCESESPCRYVHKLFNANDVISLLVLISAAKIQIKMK